MIKLGYFVAPLLAGASLASMSWAAAPMNAQVSAVDPTAPVEFEVYLPLHNPAGLEQLLKAQQTVGSASYHQWLTPTQFKAQFGPANASMAKVQAAVRAAGLQVTETRARSFHVVGDANHVNAFLHTALTRVMTPAGKSRMVASRPPSLPAAMQQEGARIIAFTGIPPKQPNSIKSAKSLPANRFGVTGPYLFDDLKQAYAYPAYDTPMRRLPGLDGTGVNVAILMGDLLYPADLPAVFSVENFTAITGKPAPSVTTVLVDGGGAQGGPDSFEATLDVQQVLGGAPGANVTLVSIPDLSDEHVTDGYNYIVNANTFDIVNSSFGLCELEYTSADNGGVDYTYILKTYHEIFEQGNAQGITFVASSGDQGGPACPSANYGTPGANPTFLPGVSSPADDPNVTAVGGGNLVTTYAPPTLNSAYVRESAFADPQAPYDIYGVGQNVSGGYWGAGGGRSVIFARPWYQLLVDTGSRFRTVPDVGMQVGGLGFSQGVPCQAISCSPDDSSVLTAYAVGEGGGFYYTIGTSVSSPEFVGALALFSQSIHSRLGNVNYYLYLAGLGQTLEGGVNAPPSRQYYHRNIPGFDGYWKSTYPSQNYNYIYGNGSPDVRNLFGLNSYPAAGLPQTPGNP